MFRHFSKMLIFTLLACVSSIGNAAVVSVEDARQTAIEFFLASRQERLASADALELVYTAEASSKPLYYVFNARDGHGYIIVSADDCTIPVLGYSLENIYNVKNIPASMKWMLAGLEKEIKAAPSIQKPVSISERRRMARRAGANTSQHLLQTANWRQEAPFNQAIPGNPLVGCVGTAMGIIMKYYNFPPQGMGSYNGVNFNFAYDWENMRTDNYMSGYNAAEADAVATLLYHAAASVGTQFGMSGSSAYEVRVPAAMANYFGYNPGISYKKRSEVASQEEFDRIVAEEIKAGRPVLYCGQDVTAGHAFVVDGYDSLNGFIHVNWGWGGLSNDWFVTTALNPRGSQSHSFNNLTTIVYNIKPGDGDNSSWSPIHITADGGQPGMGSDLTSLSAGKTFTVRVGNLKNVSYNDFSGSIAVALFDNAGNFKALLCNARNFSLKSLYMLNNGYSDFNGCSLPAGTTVEQGDMVRIATSADNGTTWQPVPGELLTVNEIPALRTEPDYFAINFPGAVTGVSYEGDNKVIKGWNYSFSVTPADPVNDVVTVKANGYILTPAANTFRYTVTNVKEDQKIDIIVQKASEVKEKRSIWVGTPGQLQTIISDIDAGTIKDLTLFGTIDATDFEFMRNKMKLTRLDISSVSIAANGSNQANAIPKQAFQGQGQLKEIILPKNINRINNAAFRQCGITSITIPAGVSTYEYNVFLNASSLRHIWVGRETAEFINWCVLSGTNKGAMTLHVPTEKAKTNYSAKENWKEIGNIIVDPIPARNDFTFAIMEDNDVKFESSTENGRLEKGTKVTFTAVHIAENDERMAVYANNTLLTPDAQGSYSVTINDNTIIHFDLVKPTQVATTPSPWTLTDKNGSIGLLTDAVNVIPGVEFAIRANALFIPQEWASMFWAFALTDASGNIKEFISPISLWDYNVYGDGLKMTIKCCVKESTVREGNLIRLVTSYNKKNWYLVEGRTEEIVDALPALNNQTPVYNITLPENLTEKANVSGAVATAVRGRDNTLKSNPKVATDRIDMSVNGVAIAKGAQSVNYTFIAMQDMDFDIKVYTPVTIQEATIVIGEGEHLYYTASDNSDYKNLNNARIAQIKPKLKIVGKLDYSDFALFRENPTVQRTVTHLDLSEATIVADRSNSYFKVNMFPPNSFCRESDINPVINLQDVQLPPSVTRIGASAFRNCAKIKELRLPENLDNWTNYAGGLEYDCFKGCTSLTTLYVPCKPNGNKVHHFEQFNSSSFGVNTLGLDDPTKVTVVVKPEYLATYKTPYWDEWGWKNSWVKNGFNIVDEYPVYSLNYDPSRCFVAKGFDVNAISFLGNNVATESITLTDKLFIAAHTPVAADRPAGVDGYDADRTVLIYDNGILMTDGNGRPLTDTNGSVPAITYYNPNKHADKSGNHDIQVVYLYNITLNLSSDIFKLESWTIRNNESDLGDTALDQASLNYYDATAPQIVDVRENALIRFKLKMNTANEDINAKVKSGEQVITPDEEGYYNVTVTDADQNIEVFAVPANGATLTKEEFNSVNAEEAVEVTSLALKDDIDGQTLANVVENFKSLEELDLSDMTGDIPAGIFEGKSNLSVVTFPSAATEVKENTFKGCSGLTTVTIPESVNTIGAGAFSGCSSIKSITLTGINSIGSGAFEGCGNMTSININPSTQGSAVRMRASEASVRSTGFAENAFDGLNPNCLIILGEGVAVPASTGNYITTRTGEIADFDADGNPITRVGRIYEAGSEISLHPGQPFEAANPFSLGEKEISYTCELPASMETDGDWMPLVVPFDVQKLEDNSGMELVSTTQPGTKFPKADYMALSIESGNGLLKPQESIIANTPYLIKQCPEHAAREVRFSATGIKVPATPDQINIQGNDYALAATFKPIAAPAATTYILDESGSAFVKVEEISTSAENAEELTPATTDIAPFSVYAISESGEPRFDIEVAQDTPTGTETVSDDADGISFSIENGNLIIYAPGKTETAVYTIDGRLIGTISLNAGRNVLTGMSHGIYIIAGHKIMF